MKPGDEFNPWRRACGFYPPDVVGRQKTLTDGQKRVYERLVRFAGQNGDCFPQLQTLADELGKSISQVKRDVGKLEQIQLVAHKSRAGRKSNTYVFLWHTWFDGSPMTSQIEQAPSPLPFEGSPTSPQNKSDGPPVTLQARSENSDELSREVTGDRLTVRPRPTNSVQELYTGKTSSSSSREIGRLREKRTSENSTTVTTILSGQDEQNPPSEAWWTSDDVSAAGNALQRAAGEWRLAPPDVGLILAILPCMLSLDDMGLWLQSSGSLLGNAKSWGLYVADAQRWPERRGEAAAQQKRAIFEREEEYRRAEDALRQAPAESQCNDVINVAAAGELPVQHCGRCNDFGVIGGLDGPAGWCDCEHARGRRERNPNYIESYNARCAKTWSAAQGSKRLTNQRMTA